MLHASNAAVNKNNKESEENVVNDGHFDESMRAQSEDGTTTSDDTTAPQAQASALDQVFALLRLLFQGVDGEALFSVAGETIKSRDPDTIEKFIAEATDTVSVGLVTCAGQAHAVAYDCMSDEEIDEVIAALGEPSAALTRANEGGEVEPGAVLIYRRATPVRPIPCSEDDEKLAEAIPLPGTGGWGLTAASIEKLMPAAVPAADASVEVESAAGSVEARTEPFVHNDAQFVGGDLPSSVMGLKIKLGVVRSANDKRCPAKETTFFQFVNVMSKHVPGEKDGRGVLQGDAVDNERKAKAMRAMYVIGLDVDSGIQIEPVVKKIQDELGLASIVYTTHSHLTTTTYVSQSAFAKFAKKRNIDSEPTNESMQRYAREDRSWEQEIADTVIVEDEPTQTSDGVQYVLHHDRIPKFRIIFPLAEPYVIAKQKMSQDDAIQLWKGKLLGLARILKIPIDESCLDPSRLFYFPRHKRDAEFAIYVTNGAALRFEEIPELMPRSKDRPTDDVFAEAAKALGANGRSLFIGDFSLRRWAAEHAGLFDIARMFRERADERIRHDDGQDKLEIECPFDSAHSTAGDPEDRACFVESARANGSEESFRIACQHNSCKRRDRLEFLAEAVESNWITVEDLKDETFRVFTVEEDAEAVAKALIERAEALGKSTPYGERESVVREAATADISVSALNRIIAAVVQKAGFTKKVADTIVAEVRKSRPKSSAAETNVNGMNLPYGWEIDSGKLYYGNDEHQIYVCDAFELLAEFTNERGDDRSLVLGVKGKDGPKLIVLKMAALHSGRGEARAQLAGAGLTIDAAHGKKLDSLLSVLKSATSWVRFSRPGFHDYAGRMVYASPLGPAYDRTGIVEGIELADSRRPSDCSVEGNLEGWKAAVDVAIKSGNLHWILGTCAGFAGMLVSLLKESTVGLYFGGKTTQGKTTALALAASVHGSPAENEALLRNLKTTPNGFEALAELGDGSVLLLDEIGHLQPADAIGPLIFAIAGGSGKARMNADSTMREIRKWRTFAMITGEKSLKAYIESDRKRKMVGGQALRIIEINVAGTHKDIGDDFKRVEEVKRNYGHAGPTFVRHLFAEGLVENPGRLRDMLADAEEEIGAEYADAALRRAARPLALLLVAGRLAKDAGLIDIDDDQLVMTTQWALDAFLSSDSGQVLNQTDTVRDSLIRAFQLEGRFDALAPEDYERVNPQRCGFHDADFLYIEESRLVEVTGDATTRDNALRALKAAGLLEQDANGTYLFRYLKGRGKLKHYRVKKAVLLGEPPAANVFEFPAGKAGATLRRRRA